MCGIVGQMYFEPTQRVEAAAIARMSDSIRHRGPDDEGSFVAGQTGIGMRRLSIIDVDGGHQPMHTPDGRFTIVFNGEIYNYAAIRARLEGRGDRFATDSDTECILNSYARHGAECLHELNGMFAVAIWDAVKRELFLARDRIGIKPLYVHQDRSRLVFASEPKAILTDPKVPRTLDRVAASYFFRYGYVSSPATMLSSIRQVPPGHYLIASADGIALKRYWSLENIDASSLTEVEQQGRAYDLLKRAVQLQLVSDVPLGAFLSGGLDSSSIVHAMSELTSAPVSTYSIGFEGVDRFHNETEYARQFAEKYKTRHHEIIVRPDVTTLLPRLVHHLDQPLADSSFLVTYLVSTLARESVKVILSGVGGDELFAGYRRYLGPYLGNRYQFVPRPVRRTLAAVSARLPVDRGSTVLNYFRLAKAFVAADGLPPYERYDHAVQLIGPEDVQNLCPSLPRGESSLIAARRAYFHAVDDPLAQMLRLDLHTSLPDSLLNLTDKMSMAASIEARVPFLDHEFVEAVTAIPSALKVRGGVLRHIQKQSMRGRLPNEVLTRKKRGFGCPVGAWFRTDLRQMVRDTLSPAALRRGGVMEATSVQTIIEEHEGYRHDRTDVLLALLTFQVWCDEWNIQ